MATDVGTIRGRMEFDISRAKRSMDEARQHMRGMGDEANKTRGSFEALQASLTAIGASAGLIGMVRVMKSLADEANGLANSMKGLAEVSKALGVSVDQTNAVAQKFVTEGLMSMADAATAVKTSLTMGLGLEETEKLMRALGDSAAYGRASHLSLSEAIVQGVQAIKMGESELLDNTGITTNLSVLQERYAQTLGTSAAKLTEAGKIQAAYNGVLAESAIFAGNAATSLEGYTGSQNAFNQTLTVARQELGEAFMPLIQKVTEELTPLVTNFAKWASANQDVIAGVAAAGVAFTGLIAVVGSLAVAFTALHASMGGLGVILLGIGGLVAGTVAYKAASDAASTSTLKFAESQDILNAKLMQSPIGMQAEEYKSLTASIEQLNPIMEKRNDLMEQYDRLKKQILSTPFKDMIEQNMKEKELEDIARAIGELDKELKGMDFSSADEAADALARMKEQAKGAVGAQLSLEEANIRVIAGQVQQVETMQKLAQKYEELNGKEKLSEAQKQELNSVVQQLTEHYPDLRAELDKEGQLHVANRDAIRGLISEEKDRVEASAATSRAVIENLKREAEARIALLQPQLDAMKALEQAQKPAVSSSPVSGDPIVGFLGQAADRALKSGLQATTTELNAQQEALMKAKREIEKLTWDSLSRYDGGSSEPLFTPSAPKAAKTPKEKAGKTAAQLQQETYSTAVRYIDHKRAMNRMSEAEEVAALKRLLTTYKSNADIRMDLEERIRSVQDQMAADAQKRAEETAKKTEEAARKRFESSEEWIELETRKLTEKGASEREIADMQLVAWTRVRNRYAADSEYYKAADKEMYDARITLIKEAERVQKEADDERERRTKEATDSALDSITRIKDAELDAIDARRREIDAFYDDQTDAIDDTERARERQTLAAEAERYRNATSDEGKKRYAELTEQLRKMDVDDRKRSLDREREDKLDALDQQRRDIESWYDSLRSIFESFSGNMVPLYYALEDARFSAFMTTNAKIRAELASLQAAYAAAMSGSGASTAPSSTSKPAAPRAQLVKSMRGVPLFHTGRDGATGLTFASGDRLMPDEITAILRKDEYVFTPDQVRSLVGGNGRGASVVNNFNAPLIENNGDVVLEDQADIKTYHREQSDVARQLIARGERLNG
ncbi:hypothetical protein [Paenibacillus xanthanilyticus]|uniref:Phage tail tape measure protein n=1 Tax=Paenibacillus xanthanilyticus TaxID=1783531 RepID=A0ABV8KC38_9BACL